MKLMTTKTLMIKWDDNTEPDLAYYSLYRQIPPGPFEKITTVPLPGVQNKLNHEGLVIFGVTATDLSGNESEMSTASIVLRNTGPVWGGGTIIRTPRPPMVQGYLTTATAAGTTSTFPNAVGTGKPSVDIFIFLIGIVIYLIFASIWMKGRKS